MAYDLDRFDEFSGLGMETKCADPVDCDTPFDWNRYSAEFSGYIPIPDASRVIGRF